MVVIRPTFSQGRRPGSGPSFGLHQTAYVSPSQFGKQNGCMSTPGAGNGLASTMKSAIPPL